MSQAVCQRADESGRYAGIPESLRGSLMSFQQDGVRFALRRGARVLIGDEMGLGKTVQAVALLAAYKDKWPALIVTPASLKGKMRTASNGQGHAQARLKHESDMDQSWCRSGCLHLATSM